MTLSRNQRQIQACVWLSADMGVPGKGECLFSPSPHWQTSVHWTSVTLMLKLPAQCLQGRYKVTVLWAEHLCLQGILTLLPVGVNSPVAGFWFPFPSSVVNNMCHQCKHTTALTKTGLAQAYHSGGSPPGTLLVSPAQVSRAAALSSGQTFSTEGLDMHSLAWP